MRIGISGKWTARLGLLAGLLLASLYLVSADGPEYTTDQKAYYADAAQVAFVRPGLVFKIVSATIGSDGTVQARYTITDPKGLPLDRNGVYTPGVVSRSFILASIPKGKTQYLSYTTRTQTSPITGVSAVQAGADSGGTTVDNAIGDYTYTFKTKLPSSYDKTATHTIGLYGNRNLTEFDLGTNLADTTFNWVPNGSPVTVTRDVIKTLTCNKCHQDLSAHGSTGRKSLELCVLCHQPQTIDPDTGNSVDMPVMAHKIHMGEELPSVVAGTPYQIIGNAQTVADFSKVVFPADPRRCTFCHDQDTGAAQKLAYLRPNRAACGACHDNVDFATGANHRDIVQTSDKECILCHQSEGEIEFDGSVTGAHTIPTFSKELPGVVFELVSVTNAGATQRPIVQYRIKNKAGAAVLPSQMNSLSFVLAGPTTDYPSIISEDPRSGSQVASDGTATYTFKAAIPAGAKGSFSIGIQGYRNFTIQAGYEREQVVRDAGINKVVHFSVDGTPVVPRRTVVSLDNCNKCHAFLSLHGGNRNTVEMCVLCHNPNATDVSRRPAAQMPAQSIDMRLMIHKIHTGEELGPDSDYTVYGFSGPVNFNEVLYPGDRRRCNACHVNNSQQLPLDKGLLQVQDPRGYISPAGPVTAACTSCHTSLEAASHADINTGRLGESCTVCHGTSADFSVDKVHAQ
jgi:OmcA/MtrC family decaheme c-type cytochrome